MALQILKSTLVLLAVFVPFIVARAIFMQKMGQWFKIKETSFFSCGFPATKEGYLLSAAIIVTSVVLLMVINSYL